MYRACNMKIDPVYTICNKFNLELENGQYGQHKKANIKEKWTPHSSHDTLRNFSNLLITIIE